MRTITDKKELAEFFRDELLPYYERYYREYLTLDYASILNLEYGLCLCARYEFRVDIYKIVKKTIFEGGYLFTEIMHYGYSAKESLLPRIEWMKQFIKETL